MTRDADGAALLAHLQTHVHTYFDGARPGDFEVDLLASRHHSFSKTYVFRVAGSDVNQNVLVKVLSLTRAGAAALERSRPRLAPVQDWVNIRPRFEYRSLAAASEHFRQIGDPRLSAVRPLDYIADHRAIVMEVIDQPTLRQLLWKAARFAAPVKGMELDRAFRHAGAWLREFHHLPQEENGPATLRATREDVAEAFTAYGEFLGKRLSADRFFEDVVATAAAHSVRLLPTVLPLGLGHGDFAPRNIFVSPNCCVTVIDMIGKWRVPIYEDIAYFLTALRTSAPQRLTFGLALDPHHLERYENELLTGYFGDQPVPRGGITVFHLLVTLDKWSAFTYRRSGGRLSRRVLGEANREITKHSFFSETRRLVNAIVQAGT